MEREGEGDNENGKKKKKNEIKTRKGINKGSGALDFSPSISEGSTLFAEQSTQYYFKKGGWKLWHRSSS